MYNYSTSTYYLYLIISRTIMTWHLLHWLLWILPLYSLQLYFGYSWLNNNKVIKLITFPTVCYCYCYNSFAIHTASLWQLQQPTLQSLATLSPYRHLKLSPIVHMVINKITDYLSPLIKISLPVTNINTNVGIFH